MRRTLLWMMMAMIAIVMLTTTNNITATVEPAAGLPIMTIMASTTLTAATTDLNNITGHISTIQETDATYCAAPDTVIIGDNSAFATISVKFNLDSYSDAMRLVASTATTAQETAAPNRNPVYVNAGKNAASAQLIT